MTVSLFDLLKSREIKLEKTTAKPFGKVEAKLIKKKDILRVYLSKGSLSNCEEVADGVAERSVTDLARFSVFKLDLNDGLYQICRWERLQVDWLLVSIQIWNDLDHGKKWFKRTVRRFVQKNVETC